VRTGRLATNRLGRRETMLALKDIHAGYGGLSILRGVSLEVGNEEVVAVLGANGTGKSTLLRTIAGLLSPDRGWIVFDDKPIHGRRAHDLTRLGIGHVPSGRELFPELSVADNLMLGGLWTTKERRRALRRRVLSLFPALEPLLRRPAARLSGGEQQMVAIGRALMTDPHLLLLDEPSMGLAPKVVSTLFSSLSWLIREEGLSVLLVEQNARLALSLADRAYVLEHGRCDLTGRAADISGDPRVVAAYLGSGRLVMNGKQPHSA
jgi:branched-chain amino acid transport system ATP-binding protein